MNKINDFLIIGIAVTLLGGCGRKNPDFPNTTCPTLEQAADSVSDSLLDLAEIEQAANPPQQIPEPPPAELYGMAEPVSIDWVGPIEPLLKKLARACDYKLRVLGTAPAIPVLINITKKDTAIADVIRDVGYLAHQNRRARVLIFPNTKVIELRYAAA